MAAPPPFTVSSASFVRLAFIWQRLGLPCRQMMAAGPPIVIGFDVEWKPTFIKGSPPRKAALVQLAYACQGGQDCRTTAEDRGRRVVVLLLHIMHSGITKKLQVKTLANMALTAPAYLWWWWWCCTSSTLASVLWWCCCSSRTRASQRNCRWGRECHAPLCMCCSRRVRTACKCCVCCGVPHYLAIRRTGTCGCRIPSWRWGIRYVHRHSFTRIWLALTAPTRQYYIVT